MKCWYCAKGNAEKDKSGIWTCKNAVCIINSHKKDKFR